MAFETMGLHQIMTILEGIPVALKFQFLAAETDEEHVMLTYNILKAKNIWPFGKRNELPDTKSKEKSIQLRVAGNKATLKKKTAFSEALEMFSESIATAPYPRSNNDNSEELGAAFANRSYLLFKMKKYTSCLRDTDRALMFNCPDATRQCLLKQRQNCVQAMRSKDPTSELDTMEELSTAIGSLLIDDQIVSVNDRPVETMRLIPQKTYGDHATIPCASNCLEIKYSPEMGRFMQATRNIKPGDIIVVEEPFTSIVRKDFYYTHCYNCLQRYEAMIPCKHCALAMYCCDDCRTASWRNSHHIECALMPILIKINGIDKGWLSLMALRMLLAAVNMFKGVRGLYDHVQKGKCYEKTKGIDDDGNYIIDLDYDTVHYLPVNIAPRKKDASMSTLAACIVIGLETHTIFFADDPTNIILKSFIGGLLLRYINLSSNVYRVGDQIMNGKNTLEIFEFGSAIYAISSLFNHSCNPHMFRCNRGDAMALVAIRPVKKGEQIFLNYGATYLYDNFEQRASFLRDYYFECRCEACVEKWPLKRDLALLGPTYICVKCSTTLPDLGPGTVSCFMNCPRCGHLCNLLTYKITEQEVLKTYTAIRDQVRNGIPVECFSVPLGSMLTKLTKFMRSPSILVVNCQELMQDSFLQGANGNVRIKQSKK